jgi:hypothetical protein
VIERGVYGADGWQVFLAQKQNEKNNEIDSLRPGKLGRNMLRPYKNIQSSRLA